MNLRKEFTQKFGAGMSKIFNIIVIDNLKKNQI